MSNVSHQKSVQILVKAYDNRRSSHVEIRSPTSSLILQRKTTAVCAVERSNDRLITNM